MKIKEPLKALIIDTDDSSISEITEVLDLCKNRNDVSLVDRTYRCHSLSDSEELIKNAEINTVIVDPLNVGLDEVSKFIFNIRNKLPDIVFVLYCNSDEVEKIYDEYYKGERSRFHHYFRINKKSKGDKLKNKVYDVIHLCLAEIRLRRYHSKTLSDCQGIPQFIQTYIDDYKKRFSDKEKTAFVVMRFDCGKPNEHIYEAIKKSLDKYGIFPVRADEHEFSDNLLHNIEACIHGCDLGIAVFDRISCDEVNPNVSFEVGYMRALQKPLCILKDQSIKSLHTDLAGTLYSPFDAHDAESSIDLAIRKWIAKRAFA